MTKNSVVFALTLIRHGETQCNKDEIIQGQQDVPLSEEGVKQAVLLGSRLQNQKYTHVFASDLARALQTTNHVLEKNNLCKSLQIQKDPRLRERKYGTVEGKTRHDLRRAARKQKQSLRNFTPPGGETIHQVRQRAENFFKELCQQMVGRKLENLNTPKNGTSSLNLQLPQTSRAFGSHAPLPPDRTLSSDLPLVVGASTSQSTEVVYVVPNSASRPEAKCAKSQETRPEFEFDARGGGYPGASDCRKSGMQGLSDEGSETGRKDGNDLNSSANAAVDPGCKNGKQCEEVMSTTRAVSPPSKKAFFQVHGDEESEASRPDDSKCQDAAVSRNDSAANVTETVGNEKCENVVENVGESQKKRAKLIDPSPVNTFQILTRTRFHIEGSDDETAEPEVYKDVTPNVVVSRTSKEPVAMQRCDSDPFMDVGEDVVLRADILVVSHGGFLRELIRHFIDDLDCIVPGGDVSALTVSPNTGVSKFMISFSEDNDKPQLTCIFIHDREHLNIATYKNTKFNSVFVT